MGLLWQVYSLVYLFVCFIASVGVFNDAVSGKGK